MKNSRYSIFFLFLFFSFSGDTQTNESGYSFATITSENGLSNNIVYDIIKDSRGYIWIATDNGLNRYNGYTSKKFFHKATDSGSVSSSVIRSLIEDPYGNLWIGTKNGLNLFDKKTQKFKRPINLRNASFINQEVMKMASDSKGKIWINTLNDIGFFNPETHHFQSVYSSDTNPYMSLADDKVWIMNKKGTLSCYDINANKLVTIVKNSSLGIKALYFGEQSNQLWIPPEFESIVPLNDYRLFPKLPNDLVPNHLQEIDSNTLWIGTNKGLFEYDYKLKKVRKITLDESTLVEQIKCIYKDNIGGVWVGTLGGVYHYDLHRKVFNHLDFHKDSDDIIMGIHAEKNGVYVNTLGKGIYFKAFRSEELQEITLPKSFSRQGLFVWDIEVVSESDFPVWLATNNGLLCYNPSNSSFQKVEIPQIDNDQDISFSILNTDDNDAWFSSYKAIHQISKKERNIKTSFSLTKFMKHSGVQKIVALGSYIFIATEGEGLLCFDTKTHEISKINANTKTGTNQLFKTPIWDLYVADKILWIGTNQGLYSLNLKDMVITPILEDDQIIFSIIQDNDGILWMGSDKVLKSYNPSNQFTRYYNTHNELKNKEFNRKSVTNSADGNLWFGGVNGITAFNPKKIKKDNPNKPYVYITGLEVVTSDSTFSVPYFQKQIVLPWKHNTIEIAYVGLNYTNPSQNSFKYKMEGYDPNWASSNEPNKARYVRLPVGTYTFKVTAANNDAIWNTDGDTIEIKIIPPFWRTKTAYFLYALMLIGLIGLIRRLKKYRNRIVEVELEKELIAKKVEEVAIILNNKSKVYLDTLKYIKSDGNYLEFVTDNKTIIDRNKLKAILDRLPPNFVRVHRSYVVNKNFISALNSTTLFLKPNIEIPLSRTFKSNIAS